MKEIEKEILEYLTDRKWNNLKPGDISKSISIEASELLEVFQWSNPTVEEVKKDPEALSRIKAELADVLIYCIDLSVTMGFDTSKIILDKLSTIKAKYPKEIFENKSTDPGTDKDYWDIKQEYRKL